MEIVWFVIGFLSGALGINYWWLRFNMKKALRNMYNLGYSDGKQGVSLCPPQPSEE